MTQTKLDKREYYGQALAGIKGLRKLTGNNPELIALQQALEGLTCVKI